MSLGYGRISRTRRPTDSGIRCAGFSYPNPDEPRRLTPGDGLNRMEISLWRLSRPLWDDYAVGPFDAKEKFMLETTTLDAVFTYEVSDDALETAAGDNRGLFCSCGGCTSACSQGSK